MLELSWQCGILLFFMDIGTVLTVRYFIIFLLELSWMWYFVVFHGCLNCSDSVVFCYFSIRTVLTVWYLLFFIDVGTVLTVWYFVIFLLELSWQCGIMLFFYWNCHDSVVLCYFFIGTVLTVWYCVVFHRYWNCSDSVVFCCFSIGTFLTVWYFVVFHGCWNCSDSVVFCFFLLELSRQCGILLFFMDVGTGLTVWYFVVFHWILELFWLVFCCFSWISELFWQCGILLFFY